MYPLFGLELTSSDSPFWVEFGMINRLPVAAVTGSFAR